MGTLTEVSHPVLAWSRARIYGFLASIYSRPPGEPEFQVLTRWLSSESDLPPGSLPVLMGSGLEKIKGWLEQDAPADPDERKAALEPEFVRLFRGLRRGPSPPPPYESVYRDGGLLYGPSTDAVSRKYQQFSLKTQAGEPPDHLALELDFMRFLCEKEAEALEAKQDVSDWLAEQSEFLQEHLIAWLPRFCQTIRESRANRFYEGIADFTQDWLDCDREIICGLRGSAERD